VFLIATEKIFPVKIKSEYIFTMFLRGKEIVSEESKKNLTGQLEQPAAAIHLSPIIYFLFYK
jgi:hypothetical protein